MAQILNTTIPPQLSVAATLTEGSTVVLNHGPAIRIWEDDGNGGETKIYESYVSAADVKLRATNAAWRIENFGSAVRHISIEEAESGGGSAPPVGLATEATLANLIAETQKRSSGRVVMRMVDAFSATWDKHMFEMEFLGIANIGPIDQALLTGLGVGLDISVRVRIGDPNPFADERPEECTIEWGDGNVLTEGWDDSNAEFFLQHIYKADDDRNLSGVVTVTWRSGITQRRPFRLRVENGAISELETWQLTKREWHVPIARFLRVIDLGHNGASPVIVGDFDSDYDFYSVQAKAVEESQLLRVAPEYITLNSDLGVDAAATEVTLQQVYNRLSQANVTPSLSTWLSTASAATTLNASAIQIELSADFVGSIAGGTINNTSDPRETQYINFPPQTHFRYNSIAVSCTAGSYRILTWP